ncbi:MAG: DUF5107 domain-containing protein [Anaerolineae bacterium]|nr:DUF5107 domain-containing protein [Anaerolineae bacterium]
MKKQIYCRVLCLIAILAIGAVLKSSQTRAQTLSPPVVTDVQVAGAQVYASTITLNAYDYWNFTSPKYDASYNLTYPILDWGRYDHEKTKAAHVFNTIVMENTYLKLTLVPSLGGRIYSLEFKPTGHNEFYSNPVIKPTHWGHPAQGWWMAVGGMEWCLPVDEHGFEWITHWTATPVAGIDEVAVELRDTLDANRLRATILVRLPADRAYFDVHIRIENPTNGGLWLKYWTNTMLAPGALNTLGPDFHFILPIDQATVHSSGDPRLPGAGGIFGWPWHNGVNWSRLGNWDQWLGFFAYPQAARPFQGAYDTAADEGIARIFPHTVARGAKGFAWGWARPIPAEWTDSPKSYYAEIHGGLAPTFWDSAYLPPKSGVEWTETWYPVAGIGWLSAANAEAALGLRAGGSQVIIGAQPTITRTDSIVALCRPGESTPLHVHTGTLTPASPYKTTLTPGGSLSDLVLSYLDRAGSLLATTAETIDYRPPTAGVNDLPPYVTDPDDLVVSWSGIDRETCLVYYDVQVKDGYNGMWTDWLTHTTALSGTYLAAIDGHTYFFRARAVDMYGNWSPHGDPEWGQAFTSLLVTPAPVLETSYKSVGAYSAIGGEMITYTLSLRNTGSADTTTLWLADTLPGELILLTDTVRAVNGGVVTWTHDAVRWQGTITAGQSVEVIFAAQVQPTVTVDLSAVDNVMQVGNGEVYLERQSSFLLGRSMFLPLVFRNGMP